MSWKVPVFISIILFCTGCDLIDYHPYDARVTSEKDINRKNIALIEQRTAGKSTIRFVMMGDSQRWYDETEDFVKYINQRDDIDFVIHGGDLSDFGMTREFEWMHRILKKLKIPYVALMGNHDILGNGYRVYKTMYGEENFSFTAAGTKFLCINTNALEYDYSTPIPDFYYIKTELTGPSIYDRTVAVMHAPPHSEQFNNNVATYFHETLLQFNNLLFCLHAHNHEMQSSDIFEDGIVYYGSPAMKDRCFLVFTISGNNYSYEVVEY